MNPHDKFLEETRARIASLGKAKDLQELSRRWIHETSKYRYSYNFRWLGRPIIQYPQDIVAIQEIFWRVRPDLVIETGIAHGGSIVLSASMLALLDYCDALHTEHGAATVALGRRRVIGIDIDVRQHNRDAIESHALAGLITMIEGSSTSEAVISQVRTIARDHRRVLVLLDSDHTADHVLQELRAYAPLVTPESYCVVFDTIIEQMPTELYPDRPWKSGNSPMTAVNRYLSELHQGLHKAADGSSLHFEVDRDIDNALLVSVAPEGYLRRISAALLIDP